MLHPIVALEDYASSTESEGDEVNDDEVQDPNEPIGDIDLEIVGLASSTNGRSCQLHTVCGDSVEVGNVLRLVNTVVTIAGFPEPAIKLVKLDDGVDGCTVAYVPRVQATMEVVQANIGKFCVVKELYNRSTNRYKRVRSHRNMGMAGVVLLSEVPISE
jgi:hypothetical protein